MKLDTFIARKLTKGCCRPSKIQKKIETRIKHFQVDDTCGDIENNMEDNVQKIFTASSRTLPNNF